ncbi:MAG: trypsin-like peptidase domain-containing protein [Candidatus Hydrogenedentes bacterium]|nr:trypsin-like peptidase domain-containing protein [Candidatus Hydrogenedentota bacterium]
MQFKALNDFPRSAKRPFTRLRDIFVRCALASLLVAMPTALRDDAAPAASSAKMAKARTELSDVPWDPASLALQPKLVYGTDDRLDVYQETDPLRLELAAATCAVMRASRLTDNGNGTFTFSTSAYLEFGLPACETEPYGAQPVAAFCTGWLAGKDLIATAGHCFDESDIGAVVFVFGFDMTDATTPVTTVNASQVYTGTQVVARELTSAAQDYAIVRVDRTVTAPGAHPLGVRRAGTITVGTPVGVIGHPAGLPTKIAFGSTTTVADSSDPTFFLSNLDTYGGNSGSPVFNQATGVVEGILVRGNADYVPQGSCFVSNQLPDSSAGEESTKASAFQAFIPVPAADIDGDGAINAVDIQLVINAALAIDIGGMNADVNGDGHVDAVDIQAVINSTFVD